ncbi:tyrosine-type recombinase/integrase [Pimelobacter simplex]|uniref:Tyrosine-type recombinase/integrase n=1 Tax=Nocardioides simplex TaxID=2045 RepID=A0A7J5DVT7_NOCSI|nr:tyrosine-type recombinase/integrase [Pimelobacter simplex]KAB2809310.1 tyrosine-type recombinase/integrase [Pimelobacter simplex]
MATNWATLLAGWENYMRASRLTDETIKLRTYHVRRVAEGVAAPPGAVTAQQLIDWLAAQEWKPNTAASYRASLRSFYRWAVHARGTAITHSPAHELPRVRVPRGKARPTPEAVYRLALRISDRRVGLALMLGGVCGMRRGEIARSRRDWLEPALGGYVLRVRGKGGHERVFPVPDMIARAITSQPEHPSGFLFPSKQGGHLTPAYLGKMVKAALDGHTTHTLRHRAGTNVYDATKDLRAVQEFLGHAKPETTAIYTGADLSGVLSWMEAEVS